MLEYFCFTTAKAVPDEWGHLQEKEVTMLHFSSFDLLIRLLTFPNWDWSMQI